jgi:hypothetical protein
LEHIIPLALGRHPRQLSNLWRLIVAYGVMMGRNIMGNLSLDLWPSQSATPWTVIHDRCRKW